MRYSLEIMFASIDGGVVDHFYLCPKFRDFFWKSSGWCVCFDPDVVHSVVCSRTNEKDSSKGIFEKSKRESVVNMLCTRAYRAKLISNRFILIVSSFRDIRITRALLYSVTLR